MHPYLQVILWAAGIVVLFTVYYPDGMEQP